MGDGGGAGYPEPAVPTVADDSVAGGDVVGFVEVRCSTDPPAVPVLAGGEGVSVAVSGGAEDVVAELPLGVAVLE